MAAMLLKSLVFWTISEIIYISQKALASTSQKDAERTISVAFVWRDQHLGHYAHYFTFPGGVTWASSLTKSLAEALFHP